MEEHNKNNTIKPNIRMILISFTMEIYVKLQFLKEARVLLMISLKHFPVKELMS